MVRRQLAILLPIMIIVVVSFGIACGLFKLLESTATIRRGGVELTGGLGGFVVVGVLLYSWYERREKRQQEELAIEIARLSVENIMKEAGNKRNKPKAINAAYSVTRYQLSDNFRRQHKHWLALLLAELKEETRRQARQYGLIDWEPTEAVLDEADEVAEDIGDLAIELDDQQGT